MGDKHDILILHYLSNVFQHLLICGIGRMSLYASVNQFITLKAINEIYCLLYICFSPFKPRDRCKAMSINNAKTSFQRCHARFWIIPIHICCTSGARANHLNHGKLSTRANHFRRNHRCLNLPNGV